MENIVHEPTHFTTDLVTCLDLCITNNSCLVNNVCVHSPICSTHAVEGFELSYRIYKQHAYKRVIRNYNLANFDTYNNDLLSTDWDSEEFNSDNVNDVYSNFTNKLEECISRNIQTKTITVGPNIKIVQFFSYEKATTISALSCYANL